MKFIHSTQLSSYWIQKAPHFHKMLFWWGRLGLNQRPTGYEPAALTAELRPQRLPVQL